MLRTQKLGAKGALMSAVLKTCTHLLSDPVLRLSLTVRLSPQTCSPLSSTILCNILQQFTTTEIQFILYESSLDIAKNNICEHYIEMKQRIRHHEPQKKENIERGQRHLCHVNTWFVCLNDYQDTIKTTNNRPTYIETTIFCALNLVLRYECRCRTSNTNQQC